MVRESFFMDVILELSSKGYIEIKEIKGQAREIFQAERRVCSKLLSQAGRESEE